MAVGVQTVQRKQLIGAGEGYVQVGTGEKDLQDIGSLEGNVSLSITRETIPVMDGNPEVVIDHLIIREIVTLGFVLKEQFVSDILRTLGYDPDVKITDTTVTSTVARTDEQKVLWGTEWSHLKGKPVLVSPAATVDDGGATPVSYSSSTDYEINLAQGLIRRRTGSTIANGGRVFVNYSYTQQKNKAFSFGHDMENISTYYWRFVYTRRDGKRQVFEVPIATFANPTALLFNKGGLNTREVNLQVLADTSLPSGEQYITGTYEYSDGA